MNVIKKYRVEYRDAFNADLVKLDLHKARLAVCMACAAVGEIISVEAVDIRFSTKDTWNEPPKVIEVNCPDTVLNVWQAAQDHLQLLYPNRRCVVNNVTEI